MKKEYCFIMNIFTLSLPPSPKKSGGEEGKTFVKEIKTGVLSPFLLCLSEYGFQEKYLPYCSPCFFQIHQRIFSSLRVTIGVTTKEKGFTALPVNP